MSQIPFNLSEEFLTEGDIQINEEGFEVQSSLNIESARPPKGDDHASEDDKTISDTKCFKETSLNDSPGENERWIHKNQTFSIEICEGSIPKTPKRQTSSDNEEPECHKLLINNQRISEISTTSSDKSERKKDEDAFYSRLNHNISPSAHDQLDSDHVEEANQEVATGVNEKGIKRSQSSKKFAYPAIFVYIYHIFRSMFFSEAKESACTESPSDELIRAELYKTIASCEKELEKISQKFEEKKSELNKNCEKQIQELALSTITKKKKEIKERELKKATFEGIGNERIKWSLQHQSLKGGEIKFYKEEIIPILKADRSRFINNEVQFYETVKEILSFYELKEADFEVLKKNHIDNKSLKSMTVWESAKKRGEKKKVEENYSEKTGVMMTIIVAMAFKFIPKEEEERCLTYETRNSSTASLLYFLFTSQCEPQNLLRFRELKFRQHISKVMEKLFKDLVEKINETLLGVGKRKKLETASHTMLNKVLLSIDGTRGLHWEKEKKTTKHGGKSSKIN